MSDLFATLLPPPVIKTKVEPIETRMTVVNRLSGLPGATGPAGATGPQGPTGSSGSQGVQGEVGPQGIQGSPGAAGDTGPTGSTGSQGPQGEIGPAGPTGAQGIQGEPGTGVEPWSVAQLTVNNNAYEAESVVSAVGVTSDHIIDLRLAPGQDSDENEPEGLDISALYGIAGTDEFTVRMAFRERTAGPINLLYRVS